jgi:hypothetical protein
MRGERDVNVVNNVRIADSAGQLVAFQGRDHVDVSSAFSDTVDLDGGPGYIYVGAAGTLELMLANSTVALPYVFTQAGVYPLVVKRIMATGSDAITVYLVK